MSIFSIAYASDIFQVPEEAIRLILSLFICLLLAAFYRHYLLNFIHYKIDTSQIYFLISGLLIGYFNFGFDVVHSVVAVLATFFVLNWCPRSTLFTWCLIAAHFTHLLIGYWFNQANDYSINWTTAHCVLVLKVTATIVELSKPKRRKESLDFLNFSSFIYFPATLLVGPQVPYDHYVKYVSRLSLNDKNFDQEYQSVALRRFLQSLFYLSASVIGALYVSNEYLTSEPFNILPFWQKMLILGVWGRIVLYKYIACWLLVESSAILFGLAFSPEDDQFQKCQNVILTQFENTLNFNHFIKSFNICTNHWLFTYIYTPIKNQRGPLVAQMTCLIFLAYWHGFSSGYLLTFMLEFFVIFFERNLKKVCGHWSFWSVTPIRWILNIILRLYTVIFMGYCLIPFVFLTYDRYWPVLKAVHFVGFIMFFPWPFFIQLLQNKH